MQCRSDRVEQLEAKYHQFCHLEGCYGSGIMHAYYEAPTGERNRTRGSSADRLGIDQALQRRE